MLVFLVCLLAVSSTAPGQIWPDPRMTKIFKDELKGYAKAHKRVFVSDCNLVSGGKEKGVLIFPFGSASGEVVLAQDGDLYNAVRVSFEKNRPILDDPLGGEWSNHVVDSVTNQLIKFRFKLVQPDDVVSLLTSNSSDNCVGFWNH